MQAPFPFAARHCNTNNRSIYVAVAIFNSIKCHLRHSTLNFNCSIIWPGDTSATKEAALLPCCLCHVAMLPCCDVACAARVGRMCRMHDANARPAKKDGWGMRARRLRRMEKPGHLEIGQRQAGRKSDTDKPTERQLIWR